MSVESELQRLYDEHAQALFAFLMNFTRDENDTCDALQQIFIRLASKPALLQGVRSERSFLIRLAHNTAIDLMRRRGTRQKYHEQAGEELKGIFDDTGDPDEAVFQNALSLAMAELPEEQRAVVHLKLW